MPEYELINAENQPEEYRLLFAEYCNELTQEDPAVAQYDPFELANGNLNRAQDHPFLIRVQGNAAGLVVFTDETGWHLFDIYTIMVAKHG